MSLPLHQKYSAASEKILKQRNGRPIGFDVLAKKVAKLVHPEDPEQFDSALFERSVQSFAMQIDSKMQCTSHKLTEIGSASVIGSRDYQEDRIQIIQRKNLVAAAVFDGHCGDDVSIRLSGAKTGLLKKLILCDEALPPVASQSAARKLFLEYDAQLPKDVAEHSGSTAVVMVQRQNSIALYNVGDSRACIYNANSGEALMATRDHKLEEKCEMQRILHNGKNIEWDDEDRLLRVEGNLAMSRAFGDHAMGVSAVIAAPDVYLYQYPPNQDIVVVLASDGLWDEYSTAKVGKTVQSLFAAGHSSKSVAEHLVQVDQPTKHSDNTTAIVARFISQTSCNAK